MKKELVSGRFYFTPETVEEMTLLINMVEGSQEQAKHREINTVEPAEKVSSIFKHRKRLYRTEICEKCPDRPRFKKLYLHDQQKHTGRPFMTAAKEKRIGEVQPPKPW